MGIILNPINNLERSIYKNISREKIHNQNQREAYIAELDKIVEDQSRAHEEQAKIAIISVVAMVVLRTFVVMADCRINQNQLELNQLMSTNKESFINQLPLAQREGLINQFAPGETIVSAVDQYFAHRGNSLKQTINSLSNCKNFFSTGEQVVLKVPEITNFYSQSKLNQLQHVKQIKDMHLSQLNQERINSHTQNLLHEIKDMRRRKQQTRAAVGG